MFTDWSNVNSSNARVNPSKVNIISETSSSESTFARRNESEDERPPGFHFSPCLDNATYIGSKGSFNGIERRDGMSKVERLELYNRGNHNWQWTIDETVKNDGDDLHFCRALASQMSLSERGKGLMWRVFKRMAMRAFRSIEPGESKETMKQFLVAFCVGALIYNQIHREYSWTDGDWKYYPGRTPTEKSRRYLGPEARIQAEEQGDGGDRHRTIERCADSLGFSETEIRSCMEKVRADMPAWIPST